MRAVARGAAGLVPGLAACLAVSAAALGAQRAQEALIGRAHLDALVIAILLGMLLRTAWTPGPAWTPGIAFTGKTLLEIAVALLGALLSVRLVLSVGPALLLGIVAVVAVSIPASYAIGRGLGLPWRMALLVACGNSICGNSAIAAVAPVIGASPRDVASAVAFTAVLGVVVVLGLPLFVPLAGLSETQYGVVAGLTVYAVPQVLAATAPVGPVSVQIGTFVKLVRVLLLGPVVTVLSVFARRWSAAGGAGGTGSSKGRLVPWFILGFLALMALRSLGAIPAVLLEPIAAVTKALTILAMAALGIGVDARDVARAGGPVTLTVILSLALLAGLSVALVALGIGG
jgi:uncharacterized integral membrane protein (TIGR00698 family)